MGMGAWPRLAVVCALSCAAAIGCGDDEPDSDAVPVDATPRPDAFWADARPPAPDAMVRDASPPDAAAPDADLEALPDLVAEAITRDGSYYRVQFCNRGLGVADGLFRVQLINVASGDTFDTAAAHAVPAPGMCALTGGITCGLIGDAACDLAGDVRAVVDSDDAIAEADETNNGLTVMF